MSQIIIEVSGGVVQSVYNSGPIPATLEVVVVDLDGDGIGEPTRAFDMPIEGIRQACGRVIDAMADYNNTAPDSEPNQERPTNQ